MPYGLLTPDPRLWATRAPAPLVVPHTPPVAPRPTIWDRLRVGGERLFGIPQDAGLLAPEDRSLALRQGLLSAGAAVANSDPSQGILHGLVQGVAAGRGGAMSGIEQQDAFRARRAGLDRRGQLAAIQAQYMGKDPAAYARALALGGFFEEAKTVAESLKALQPEKANTFETTGADGVVRVYDRERPNAPPVVLGPVGKPQITPPAPNPDLKEIDVSSDPGHKHWGRWDAKTNAFVDTGSRVGTTDPNLNTKITPEQTRQAGIGGSAAQAFVALHDIEQSSPTAVTEVQRALASPSFVKVIPFIGNKAADAVTAMRQVGLSDKAQEYLNAIWELGGQAARQQGRGMTRSLPVLQQLYNELGANLGEGPGALTQKRKNRYNVILGAKDQSSPDLLNAALKERGLTWADVEQRSPYAPEKPAEPTKDPLRKTGGVLDQHLGGGG